MRLAHTALAALAAVIVATAGARATTVESHECFSQDVTRRIEACGQLLQLPDLDSATRASAFAQRALALSLIGRYDDAIADYDQALDINPNFPVALNNRAWAKFRSGDVAGAWPDVSRSLSLDPWSPHAHDTRGHLNHVEGRASAAYTDYKTAMSLGGQHMVRLYQCGLQGHGHYDGPLNGIVTEAMLTGLKACTEDRSCDPLPPDEECKAATS